MVALTTLSFPSLAALALALLLMPNILSSLGIFLPFCEAKIISVIGLTPPEYFLKFNYNIFIQDIPADIQKYGKVIIKINSV